MPTGWFKKRVDRLIKDVGFQIIQILEHVIVRFSPHDNTKFFDPKEFPWTNLLEENWEDIRREVDEVVLKNREVLPNFQDISEDQKAITTDDNWKTYFLYGFGHKAEKNCARVPRTTELVEQVPGMKTAFFSILSPGKHIPSHRGPYKGVMRYHLGLKIPEPAEACRIRVGDEIRHWEQGESLMFDDTHDHEVWNDTDGERVILFMDVVRPLDPPMDTINRFLISLIAHSPFVQDAKHNQEAWEERIAKAVPRA